VIKNVTKLINELYCFPYIFRQYSEMKYATEWNKRGRFQFLNQVGGVFKAFEHADSDDSDEDDDDVQFLTFKEIKSTSSGGKRFLKRTRQRQNKGMIDNDLTQSYIENTNWHEQFDIFYTHTKNHKDQHLALKIVEDFH
jgi:hypothetical protein